MRLTGLFLEHHYGSFDSLYEICLIQSLNELITIDNVSEMWRTALGLSKGEGTVASSIQYP